MEIQKILIFCKTFNQNNLLISYLFVQIYNQVHHILQEFYKIQLKIKLQNDLKINILLKILLIKRKMNPYDNHLNIFLLIQLIKLTVLKNHKRLLIQVQMIYLTLLKINLIEQLIMVMKISINIKIRYKKKMTKKKKNALIKRARLDIVIIQV